MLLRSLKLATVISFCWIIIGGNVIGGPLWMFIFLGLFSKEIIWTSYSLLGIIIITLFVYSIFHPRRTRDVFLFSAVGAIFIVPVGRQLIFHRLDIFFWMPLLFLTLSMVTTISIYSEKSTA